MATKLIRRGAVERKRVLFALLLESLPEDANAPPLLVKLVVKLVVIVLPKTNLLDFISPSSSSSSLVFLLKKKTIFLSCVFVSFRKKNRKKKEGKFFFYFLFLSLGKKERIFVYIGALLLQTKTESGHIF